MSLQFQQPNNIENTITEEVEDKKTRKPGKQTIND